MELANAAGNLQRYPIRRHLVVRADHGCALFCRKITSDLARNPAGLFPPGSKRAADRIDHSPFHFVDRLARKIFKAKCARVLGKLISQGLGHEKRKLQSANEFKIGKSSTMISLNYPAGCSGARIRVIDG